MEPKVAFLLGSLNRGGAETLILDVLSNAKKNEFNPICVYRKSGALMDDFLGCGINLYKLPFSINALYYIIRLRKLITTNNITIIHAHQPIDALVAILVFMFSNIKIIQTIHEYDFSFNSFSKLLLGISLKFTSGNIFVSACQQDYFVNKYKLKSRKQITIYNGISFDKFHTKSDSNIRNELGIDFQTLLIGTVGNFVPGRDQFTICKFLKLMHDDNIDFRFLFIGAKSEACPERFELCYNFIKENNLNQKVYFLGSRKDVPTILQQLNVFIYSSDHDTFGIAVVEALACGLPVFVNDWDVMKEITENGKFAFIYKTKNAKDLLHKFDDFLNNRKEFYSHALLAKETILKKFNINQHIFQLKELYNREIR